ncbi:MAG: tetratricopeptide repeat protein [Rhodospirillales bacterium]
MPLVRSLFVLLSALTLSGPPIGQALASGEEPQRDAAIYGPYIAGLAAGHRGDADTAADLLLGLSSRLQPTVAVLGPALRAAISAGRMEEALPVAESLLDLDPRASEAAALLRLADAARAGDWEAADKILRLLPGRDLSGTRRHLLQAWVTLPVEGSEAALAALEPLRERAGLRTLYLLHKALLLDVAGQPEAGEAYREALASSSPPSGRSVLLTSNYLARSGANEEAKALIVEQLVGGRGSATLAAILAELEAGDPQAPLVGDAADGLSEVFLQIGAALSGEGPRVLALQEARLSKFVAPDNLAATLLLAEILSRLDRHDEAVAHYETLIEDPRYGTVASLARADALAAADRTAEAEAAYAAMAEARAEDPEPFLRLGNLLRWDRRFAEAVAAYDQAVARKGDAQERDWLLYYFRGISNERAGLWEAAEADFQRALELRPEQPQVLNYLGYSWVERRENLAEARAMLERAVELRPRDGYIVDSLGWALYQLGDYENAVIQLEHAVELEPSQAVINDHLGDAYWRVGRQREALVQWQRTLSLGEDPDIDPEEVRLKLTEGLPPIQQAELPDARTEPAAE